VEQSFMYKKIVEELEQASLFDMFKEELWIKQFLTQVK
jgi:hypothetical protein